MNVLFSAHIDFRHQCQLGSPNDSTDAYAEFFKCVLRWVVNVSFLGLSSLLMLLFLSKGTPITSLFVLV